MKWYQNKSWDEKTHREFYDTYKKADRLTQGRALVEQARLLSGSKDNNELKAAESLLLLWVSEHYDKNQVHEVFELIMNICHRMGDLDRAKEFASKLKTLRRE